MTIGHWLAIGWYALLLGALVYANDSMGAIKAHHRIFYQLLILMLMGAGWSWLDNGAP